MGLLGERSLILSTSCETLAYNGNMAAAKRCLHTFYDNYVVQNCRADVGFFPLCLKRQTREARAKSLQKFYKWIY